MTTDLDSIPSPGKVTPRPSAIGHERLTCAIKQIGAVLIFLFVSPVSFPQTIKSFDKIKDKTYFTTEETTTSKVTYGGGKDISYIIHSMGMIVSFTCGGQVDSCEPSEVELRFIGHTSDWTMEGSDDVNFFIDGKEGGTASADWDGHIVAVHDLEEYNDVTISPELLAELAAAKAVDVQLGVYEFSLTDANLTSIRDVSTHAGRIPKPSKRR